MRPATDLVSALARTFKQLVLSPTKRRLRTLRRSTVLASAVGKAKQQLRVQQVPDRDLLDRISFGWDNEAWSASPEFQQAMLREARAPRTTVLECGTGITTLLLAMLIDTRGIHSWALEHDRTWYDTIQQRLAKFSLPSSHIALAPLKNYGEFDWYDVAQTTLPEAFGLVVCDGPPGGTRGGRYGLMPTMLQRLVPGARILFDDTQRAEEHSIMQHWLKNYSPQLRLVAEHDSYSILELVA